MDLKAVQSLAPPVSANNRKVLCITPLEHGYLLGCEGGEILVLRLSVKAGVSVREVACCAGAVHAIGILSSEQGASCLFVSGGADVSAERNCAFLGGLVPLQLGW